MRTRSCIARRSRTGTSTPGRGRWRFRSRGIRSTRCSSIRARKETTQRRISLPAGARPNAKRRAALTLNHVPFLFEKRSDAIAKIALQLDGAVQNGAARAARALQLLGQFLDEGGIPRQTVDDGHGLAAAAFLF